MKKLHYGVIALIILVQLLTFNAYAKEFVPEGMDLYELEEIEKLSFDDMELGNWTKFVGGGAVEYAPQGDGTNKALSISYVRPSNHDGNSYPYINRELENAITDKAVIELDMMTEDTNANKAILAGNKKTVPFLEFRSGGNIATINSRWSEQTVITRYTLGEWYHIRLEIDFKTSTMNIDITEKSTNKKFSVKNDPLFETMDRIDRVRIVSWNTVDNLEAKMLVDNVSLQKASYFPYVSDVSVFNNGKETSLDNADHTADMIKIKFNKLIDELTLEGNINFELPFDGSYDATSKTYTMKLLQNVGYDDILHINISDDIMDIEGHSLIIPYDIELKTEKIGSYFINTKVYLRGQECQSMERFSEYDNADLEFDVVNDYEEEKDVILIAVFYNKDGKMKNATMDKIHLMPKETKAEYSMSLEINDNPQGGVINLIMVDSLKDMNAQCAGFELR